MLGHLNMAEKEISLKDNSETEIYEVAGPDDKYAFLHEAAIIEYHGTLFAAWYNCEEKELIEYPVDDLQFTPKRRKDVKVTEEELKELEGLEDSGTETAEEEKPERPARNNYQQRDNQNRGNRYNQNNRGDRYNQNNRGEREDRRQNNRDRRNDSERSNDHGNQGERSEQNRHRNNGRYRRNYDRRNNQDGPNRGEQNRSDNS